jgi:uncharacterized membrane protein (UPF0127 family)
MPALPRFDLAAAARFLAAAALCAAAGAAAAADAPPRTITVKVGPHPLKVEVAETDAQREKGLMFRKSMGKNDGMLFIFDEPAYHAMWMKNTLIPLSVAFLDRDGVILNILDMEPQTLESHQAAGPAIYAIETNVGWYAEHKVKAGDKVTGLPKAAAR